MGSHISLAHLFKTRRGIRHITNLKFNTCHTHSFTEANGGSHSFRMIRTWGGPPLPYSVPHSQTVVVHWIFMTRDLNLMPLMQHSDNTINLTLYCDVILTNVRFVYVYISKGHITDKAIILTSIMKRDTVLYLWHALQINAVSCKLIYVTSQFVLNR